MLGFGAAVIESRHVAKVPSTMPDRDRYSILGYHVRAIAPPQIAAGSKISAQEKKLAPVQRESAALEKSLCEIKPDIAHATRGDDVHAGRAP